MLLLFLISTSLHAFSQVTKIDIDKAIDIPSLKHPYLYFTEKEIPILLKRIESDTECNDIFKRLVAEANMFLYMPVEKVAPIQGKNTRAGWSEYDNDNKYAKFYSTNQNNAYKLAFLYQLTGDQKYADKAFEFADAFCDLPSWTQRAHEFPIIYSRIMPWNVPDDQVNFSFDHMNGDAGRMMAAVYDWLYPALNKAQRDRIRGAILEKVVTRVRGNYEFHWWATAYRCNWCGVCNSGVGLAGLAILTENPQLTDIVAESYNRINNMFNELGVDGGWQEGGVYWNYGIHTSSFFADALKRITSGKYNLFNNERLKNNPVTFPLSISLPVNKSINFEDSRGGSLIGSTFLINKLATETKNNEAAWYRKELLGTGTDIFDIIWPKPEINSIAPKNPSIHFKTIDWWVMRSDYIDQNKVLVAGKAGKNNDPHHGHLDIGNFIIHWQDETYIRDIGSGAYDEKYFDDARWDYPQASSIGHNVVFVNDEKQLHGKLSKQPFNFDIGGEVTLFRTSKERDYVIMNPTNAYPKKELKQWRRHVILEKPEITILLDEVNANPDSEIKVRFHPGVEFGVHNNLVFLEGKNGKMALTPIISQSFEIQQGRHASQFVNATMPFSWIDYFDTVVKAKNEKTIIATIVLPVTNLKDAQMVASSGKITKDKSGNVFVSFSRNGLNYSFLFENRKDGLLLKE